MYYIDKKNGFTLIEMLVAMGISLILLSAVFSLYNKSTQIYHDIGIRETGQDNSESLLSILGREIKMVGNGIPFDQSNFKLDDLIQDEYGVEALVSVHYPINIANSSTSHIEFQVNESGKLYFLTADFTPTPSGNTSTLTLFTTEGLFAGDRIYINNGTINGDDGFTGIIDSVDSTTQVTLEEEWFMSAGATSFDTGSSMEAVNTIILDSSGSTITRNSGFGAITLADNASFTLTYYDKAGAVLTPPLTLANLHSQLGSIKIAVTVTSTKRHKMLDSRYSTHSITKDQLFALRSFNFTF